MAMCEQAVQTTDTTHARTDFRKQKQTRNTPGCAIYTLSVSSLLRKQNFPRVIWLRRRVEELLTTLRSGHA